MANKYDLKWVDIEVEIVERDGFETIEETIQKLEELS